jgi:hypothetical protein
MNYLNMFGLLLILSSPLSIANTLLDKLSLCTKSNDDIQRLACYDEVVDKNVDNQPKQHKLKHQVPLQVATTDPLGNADQEAQKLMPEPALAASELPKKSPIVQPQQTEFGQENIQRPEDLVQRIEASIIKVKKAHHGKLIITLDNGQVWRQTDSTRLKLRKDNVVIINRGALGSFFIGKKNANKRIRAKRVK